MNNVAQYLKTRNYTLIFDYGILLVIAASTLATIAAFKSVLETSGIFASVPALAAVLANIAAFLFCLALKSGSGIKFLLVVMALYSLFLYL